MIRASRLGNKFEKLFSVHFLAAFFRHSFQFRLSRVSFRETKSKQNPLSSDLKHFLNACVDLVQKITNLYRVIKLGHNAFDKTTYLNQVHTMNILTLPQIMGTYCECRNITIDIGKLLIIPNIGTQDRIVYGYAIISITI